MKFLNFSRLKCVLISLFSMLACAQTSHATSEKSDPSTMGIGTLTESNQQEYERFEGAFYIQWNPLSLANNTLQSDSKTYTTVFDHAKPSAVNLGVRQDIVSFGRFALFGDYSLGVDWMKGSFSSNTFKVSDSSNTADLLSFVLTPKLILGYFISDTFQPFIGLAASGIYSKLQSSLSGGNNEYMEFHYGPVIGLQVLNFPIKQLFLSADWCQFVKQDTSDQRLYADNGRAEIALGLNF